MTKRALIVDDSRLARTVLSRLLEENGVASDAAESAESALEYLKHSRPDVVFLDHNMPGIDGFQALDAIKKNPVTATIPVMMYTSEQGEVYVGQARALGALGVLPKTVQPIEVSKVLRTLHLIPGEPTARGPTQDREPQVPPATREGEIAARPSAAVAPLDAESLRALLDEVLSAKAAGREISGARFSASRCLRRQRRCRRPLPRRSASHAEIESSRSRRVLSLPHVRRSAIYIGRPAHRSRKRRRSFAQALRRDLETRRPTQLRPQSVAARAAGPSDVLGVLEWGVNQGGRYGFGTVPLDDERATVFAGLFDQLARLGFTGTVAIEVHTGRFCMDYGQNGGQLRSGQRARSDVRPNRLVRGPGRLGR